MVITGYRDFYFELSSPHVRSLIIELFTSLGG